MIATEAGWTTLFRREKSHGPQLVMYIQADNSNDAALLQKAHAHDICLRLQGKPNMEYPHSGHYLKLYYSPDAIASYFGGETSLSVLRDRIFEDFQRVLDTL